MLLKLSKVFFALLVFYYGWFQVVFFPIQNILFVLGAILMVCILMHAYMNNSAILKYITIELFMWTLFAFTSMAAGIFVAQNTILMANSLFTYFEFLILIYSIVYISCQDKSIKFFIDLFIIFSIVCAITIIFFGVEYSHGRISMSGNSNPNSDGIIMVIGICCIFFKMKLKNTRKFILLFFLIFLFLYATILTGSRKSFLSTVIIIIYWILFVAFREVKKAKFKSLLLLVLMFIVGSSILYNKLFQEAVLFQRLDVLFTSGDEIRKGMYKAAIELFKQSPLVGIGFNNYRVLSGYGTYSHSTYAEALACTGLIGVILYFIPYIILLIKYSILFFNKTLNGELISQSRVMLGLFCILLFLGIGIIHFYEMASSITFGLIIAFVILNKEYIYVNKNVIIDKTIH